MLQEFDATVGSPYMDGECHMQGRFSVASVSPWCECFWRPFHHGDTENTEAGIKKPRISTPLIVCLVDKPPFREPGHHVAQSRANPFYRVFPCFRFKFLKTSTTSAVLFHPLVCKRA
jgi:hypothetical protein